FAENWIGTLAVYAGSIDTESTGLVQATTGDMSFGGAHISASYSDRDYGEVRFGLSFVRGEGDSKQTVNAHRLTTESAINMATASARWQTDWHSDVWHFKPVAQLGVHWAQLEGADIRDDSENASGVGFKTESATRVWSDVTVGGDVEARLKFYEFDVVPRLGMSLTKAFGQTDWEVTSQLFDGKAQSRATFESARDFSARLSAGLTIASSGFAPEMTGGIFGYGAKPTGKSLPYAWTLTIDGAHEWASDSEEASYVGLSFKQLF
ncbi:MAG: hypothetical protein Q4E62_08715, partial [Sutterellaceae bacterium]|nr:hypothetical protein [Sutterellaceae bacterium]